MADHEQMNRLLHMLSERMGTPEGELRGAAERGDLSRLTAGMDPATAKQAQRLLSDEESARAFLNSPQAKALLKRLTGNG